MFKFILTILMIYFAYKFFFQGRFFLKYPGPQYREEIPRDRSNEPSTSRKSKKDDYIDYEEIE